MDNKTLPVGTAVRVKNAEAVIIGYRMAFKGNTAEAQYVLVPFPAGYMNGGNIKVAPMDEAEAMGPVFDDEAGNRSCACWDELRALTVKYSAEEIRGYVAEANRMIAKRAEEAGE